MHISSPLPKQEGTLLRAGTQAEQVAGSLLHQGASLEPGRIHSSPAEGKDCTALRDCAAVLENEGSKWVFGLQQLASVPFAKRGWTLPVLTWCQRYNWVMEYIAETHLTVL